MKLEIKRENQEAPCCAKYDMTAGIIIIHLMPFKSCLRPEKEVGLVTIRKEREASWWAIRVGCSPSGTVRMCSFCTCHVTHTRDTALHQTLPQCFLGGTLYLRRYCSCETGRHLLPAVKISTTQDKILTGLYSVTKFHHMDFK